MRRLGRVVALITATVLLPVTAAGVTVHGEIRYAGLPVTTTFPDLSSALIMVYDTATKATNTYAIPVGDTYEVPVDLEPGQYIFTLLLSPEPGRNGTIPLTGDLQCSASVTVPEGSSFSQDLEVAYMVHLVGPLDSKRVWPGSGYTACPLGAQVPESFVLTWEPAPRAVRSAVTIFRMSCSGRLADERHETSGTSLQISQGQAEGETYIIVRVEQYDAADRNIARLGYIEYLDHVSVPSALFQAPPGDRPLHTAGQIISQVAHVQGAAFWKTDLVLTNPTAVDLTTELYYTPRNADGTLDPATARVTVPAGGCRTFPDVLQNVFGRTGAGALEVASPTLVAATRTETAAPGGGSYGQGVPPILPGQLLDTPGTQTAVAGGVVRSESGGAFARSNLALNEVWGEAAVAAVDLLDAAGRSLGTMEVELPPYGNRQINDLARTLGHRDTLSDGQVRVRLVQGPGKVAATLFIVDASNDPATVPLMVR